MTVVYGILALIFIIIIYFIVPVSRLKSDFDKDVINNIDKLKLEEDIFSEEDIKELPKPVQKYFRYCGFIGTKKMFMMKAVHKNADFSTGVNKPTLNIEYTQVNFVKEPIRLAFIDSSLYGIPFQGYDSYINGEGSMKGVIAKSITLFNQKGMEMDKSSLVTVLAECLIAPNVALQHYIRWESIDDTHAKANISYYGITTRGIFTFSESGEMIKFTTEDRTAADFNGNMENIPWSAVCENYRDDNGIKKPTSIKAVWHYPAGDQVYFNCNNVKINYS